MKASSIWLFGMSGAGKTTLASLIVQNTARAILLDADTLRKGLNADLRWSAPDQMENARRIAYLAHYLAAQGFKPVVACCTPSATIRAKVREILPTGLMVFVDVAEMDLDARGAKSYPFERPLNEPGVETVINAEGDLGEGLHSIFDLIEARK